jgi:hypothetical protein
MAFLNNLLQMHINNLLLTFQLCENKRSLCLVFAFLCLCAYLFQISIEFCENCCEKTIPHLHVYLTSTVFKLRMAVQSNPLHHHSPTTKAGVAVLRNCYS